MKLLIVDDDMATVDVIEQGMPWKSLGMEEVFHAYNIDTAKKILSLQSVDIVISDIEMPQGSGLDLLEWFREQKMEGEFLLLTCHESFDYAANAVRFQAAEYLLKPFNPNVMEAAIKKMVLKIRQNCQLKENSKYGKWAKENQNQLLLAFWNMIFTGHIKMLPGELAKEIKRRNLLLRTDENYILVISKITNTGKELQKISKSLLIFIIENIHSEVLNGHPENDSVLFLERAEYDIVVTVCRQQGVSIENRCECLLEEFGKSLSASLTCSISRPCSIPEFYDTFRRNLNQIEENVIDYGHFFLESEWISERNQEKEGSRAELRNLLAFDQMQQWLTEKNKLKFMSSLKTVLQERIADRSLNEQLLKQIRQELLQVVYTYLGKKGIQAAGYYSDAMMEELGKKATWSATDMIRFCNYLIERTYYFEEEEQKKYSMIEKINQYIKEHYKEAIGRNEIAAQFYLAPEYLSKLYKKRTGKSLKEFLLEYRIEQAKIMLERGERVSDVAGKVGFDHFTYFSTTFKKHTGMTPNQYRIRQ